MRIEFNRTGAARKKLAEALAGILGEEKKYLGAPSMAYRVGKFTVTKDGALEWDEYDYPEGIDQILQDLERSGIEAPEDAEFSIEMPRDFFTEKSLENLRKIIDSKAELIKKAIGTESLEIRVTDDKVAFPWFQTEDPDEAKAYGTFIAKISEMAREAKRVNATEHEVDNEKYAFRCFLLRLGFIGAEYKQDRKILLRNLEGSSAFKSGQRGGTE